MLDANDIEVLSGLLDNRFEKQAEAFDKKLEKQSAEIREEMELGYHDIKALIEADIEPQLRLLAEGHTSIIEKMTPPQEIDDIKADISFLKDAIKYLSAKVQVLESKVS